MVSRIAFRRCTRCRRTVMVLIKDNDPCQCPECLRFFGPDVPWQTPVWTWGVIAVILSSAALLLR